MSDLQYRISLTFQGIGFCPNEISDALGIDPTSAYEIGDSIGKSIVTPSEGKRTKSYWRHQFATTSQVDLEDSITEILNFLTPHKSFLESARSGGALIELFIGLFSGENFSFSISKENSGVLYELGIDLGFDVYPFADTESSPALSS
jgi:hypothetical protein